MAEMSPGDTTKLINGATRKLGHLKMTKVMFLIISAIVCIIIFYANTSVIGRRSLFALFLSNRNTAEATSNNAGDGELLLTGPEEKSTLPDKQQQYIERLQQNRELGEIAIYEEKQRSQPNTMQSSIPRKRSRKSLIRKTILMKPPSTRNASVQLFNLSSSVLGTGIGTTSSSAYNIFVIYTKENYQLHVKFELFIKSLLKFASSGVLLHLHVLTDETSGHSVDQILDAEVRRYRHSIIYSLYNMHLCAEEVMDIVNTMTPYFSSTPKSYYSDSLFFLSLGLHRIADENMERAILLDCDIVFRSDVRLLFNEFDRFSPDHLYGLAPELTPVYRHILYRYRANYPNTDFGSPFYMTTNEIHNMVSEDSQHTQHKLRKSERHNLRHGYPGLNSGVVLLNLKRIRNSRIYHQQLHDTEVRKLTQKYMFKGHLGDQDFFTLLGYEFPNLIYRLDCVWNRQLCTWWKDHGYSDVFDKYFTCKGRIKMYHGNCNARVPE